MSLLCRESEEFIWAEDKAYAVVHPLGSGFAVSGRVLESIPSSHRRSRPCEKFEEGLDIHEGVGTRGLGTWHFSSFKKGKFLFSISKDTAQAFLPRTFSAIVESVSESIA